MSVVVIVLHYSVTVTCNTYPSYLLPFRTLIPESSQLGVKAIVTIRDIFTPRALRS